jgi:acyl-coenzyme A thioesterase 13
MAPPADPDERAKAAVQAIFERYVMRISLSFHVEIKLVLYLSLYPNQSYIFHLIHLIHLVSFSLLGLFIDCCYRISSQCDISLLKVSVYLLKYHKPWVYNTQDILPPCHSSRVDGTWHHRTDGPSYHKLSTSNDNLFDTTLMRSLRLQSATPAGTVTYHLIIPPSLSNLNMVLHGGAAALIFDMCTTTALGPLARPGYWDFLGGVTRSLNVSYLRAVPVGVTVVIRAWVVAVGKRMAMIRGEMVSLAEGGDGGEQVYCTAEHHKVLIPTQERNLAARVDWDDWWDEGAGKTKL